MVFKLVPIEPGEIEQYQKRNEWMVDRSSLVIAVWNGQPSGTKNTIDYADRKRTKVVHVLQGA